MTPKHVIVDGANVAYAEMSRDDEPKVSNLVAMAKALREEGYDPTIIVDASLRYEVGDPEQLEALLNEYDWRQAPAGTDADYFILEAAERLDAYVVSNDEFERWMDEHPWIRERRVPFMIVRGEVILQRERLGGETAQES
jgi:hypothetical protein